MGEDGLRNTVIAMGLFVIFSWLILSIAVDFGAEYGRDAQEIGDGSLKVIDFQTSAENLETSANTYRTTFESGGVDDIDDPTGIFGTIKKVINIITTPFELLSQILVNLLNFPSLFVNVVLGLLSIGLIFATWRVIRAGS